MIKPLEKEYLDEIIDILSRAYVTNPGHMAIFKGCGSKELELNRVLFRNMLNSNPWKNLEGVFIDDQLVGVMKMVRYPECAPDRENDLTGAGEVNGNIEDS